MKETEPQSKLRSYNYTKNSMSFENAYFRFNQMNAKPDEGFFDLVEFCLV